MSQRIETLISILNNSKDTDQKEEIRRQLNEIIDEFRSANILFSIYKKGDMVSKEEINILEFWQSWNILGWKKIPFELWSDLCEEGIELLKKLLEDPSIPYTELPGFKEFDDKVYERVKELKFKHGYADRFTMDAYN